MFDAEPLLTAALPLASVVTLVPSVPLTVTPPSVTVTVPWGAFALGLGEAASLALTVTLQPLPALTRCVSAEDAWRLRPVGAGWRCSVHRRRSGRVLRLLRWTVRLRRCGATVGGLRGSTLSVACRRGFSL